MRLQDKTALSNKLKEILPEYLKNNPNSALLKRPKIYTLKSWPRITKEAYWIKKDEAVNFLETDPDWRVVKMNHIFDNPHGNKGKMGAIYGFIDIEEENIPDYWMYTYLYEKGGSSAESLASAFNNGVYIPHINTSDIWPGYMCDRRDFFRIFWIEQHITDKMILETIAAYILKLIERDVQLVLDNMAIVNIICENKQDVCEMFDSDKKLFTVKSLGDKHYEKIVY